MGYLQKEEHAVWSQQGMSGQPNQEISESRQGPTSCQGAAVWPSEYHNCPDLHRFNTNRAAANFVTWELGRYCEAAPAVRVPSAALARLKPLPGRFVRSCGPFAVPSANGSGLVLELHYKPGKACQICCSIWKEIPDMAVQII